MYLNCIQRFIIYISLERVSKNTLTSFPLDIIFKLYLLFIIIYYTLFLKINAVLVLQIHFMKSNTTLF